VGELEKTTMLGHEDHDFIIQSIHNVVNCAVQSIL